MTLSEFATKNIKAILFMVGVLCLMGIAAYQTFPVSILPDVTFPRVVVNVSAGNRPIKVIETSLVRPMEDAITTIPGVKRIRSQSKRGEAELSIDFDWGTDILIAEQLVNAKVNQVRPELPPETKTEVERMNPTVFPILGLTIDSKNLSSSELYTLAQYTLRPRLARVDGVARIVVQGGLEPEVEVNCDPAKLAAFKLSLPDVVAAVTNSNEVRAVGRVNDHFQQFEILVDGTSTDADGLKHISVAQRGNSSVSLGEVADVQLLTADKYTVVSANGTESVLINVIRQPTANSVAMADAVKTEIAKLQKILPPGTHIGVFYDQSLLVREAIGSVTESVIVGAFLAVVVLMLFLGNVRATLVTAAIIPLTVLITFLLMRLSGLTLNLMTLGALAVGIGLVVDDAIVVVENVFKHLGDERDIRAAVQLASKEIARPMVSSTLTTVVVFLPLSLLQGVAGAFFSALAITLTIALMVSLALALFASPSLCAAFLRADSHREPGRLFQRFLRGYETALRWFVRHPIAVPIIGVLLLGGTYVIASKLPTGFMPELDEGAFILDYHTPVGSTLAESDRLLKVVDKILLNTPEVESFSRRTGTELGFAITEANKGDYAVMLKLKRNRKIDDVIADVRKQVQTEAPGLDVDFSQVLQDLIGDLSGNPSPIEIRLFGEDQETLNTLSETISKKLADVKGLADVQTGVIEAGPETTFRLDPVKIGRLGLSVDAVAEQANIEMYGTVASQLLVRDRSIPVRVRLPKAFHRDQAAIATIPILTPSGVMVPLGSIATVTTVPGATESSRENQRRLLTMAMRLENIDLGTGVAAVRKVIADTPMPAGVTVELGGQFKSQQDSFTNLLEVLGAAILLVYGVMVFQFGSFTAPTVVLLIMPLGLFGAVLALLVTGVALNVSSFMGAIMLVGIVVKNGILLLDRAQEDQKAGADVETAVVEAGRQRLRPILMTTLTAVLGLFPLALGIGAGAEMQRPLAITVIGGLVFSTVVTLLLGPALYATFSKGRRV